MTLGQTSAKNMLRKIEENHLRYQFHGEYIVWATQEEFFFLKKKKINWNDFWRHNLFWMQINGIAYGDNRSSKNEENFGSEI